MKTEQELKEIFNTATKKCISVGQLKRLLQKTAVKIKSNEMIDIVGYLYGEWDKSDKRNAAGIKGKGDFGLFLNSKILDNMQ